MSASENQTRIQTEKAVRAHRAHPFTVRLNNIKAKINYYNNKLKGEVRGKEVILTDEQKAEYEQKIKDLNYERFILKLNDRDLKVLKTYCEYNKIPLDIESITNNAPHSEPHSGNPTPCRI